VREVGVWIIAGCAPEGGNVGGRSEILERLMGDTRGVLYGCARKGVAERGICNFMKTKEGQISCCGAFAGIVFGVYPTPGILHKEAASR